MRKSIQTGLEVGFGWCTEGRFYLSADFPGVVEEVVQKVYGDIPVLFINGAAGDMHPALRRIPLDFTSVPRAHYERMYAQLRWREIQRIGRILGGETCKVLAELEVAGELTMDSPLLHQRDDNLHGIGFPYQRADT